MKILLDESVSLAPVAALQAEGHDVVHALTAGLGGASDDAVAELAQSQGRVLVTRDHHFANPARFPTDGSPGMVYIRPGNLSCDDEVELLRQLLLNLAPEAFCSHLITVSKTRITIR